MCVNLGGWLLFGVFKQVSLVVILLGTPDCQPSAADTNNSGYERPSPV